MSSKKNFDNLGLSSEIISALTDLGYEDPSPIQKESIPILLQNIDLLAQAPTGTGKTAAFALPILHKLSVKDNYPQALILAPTRELVLQVAEAFRSYARYISQFHVLPIYGGQEYGVQLKALKRGVHVVVGTPGRVMDHLRRGTLVIDRIKTVVLDEADEMLKMGFIDDVKWILQQISGQHQTVLFSATIPPSIRQIANQYLENAKEVRINPKAKTVAATKQCYALVSNIHKLEAITRFLEVENFDAVLIFTRTKNASLELAEKLEARGYAAAAMNGDMNQKAREKVIAQIKRKDIDIVVATDVAARGLDISRISHVISYDIPYDAESYIHRIGRTGRAGRSGKALLLVEPRERYMLREIERVIDKSIEAIDLPSNIEIDEKRNENFFAEILQEINNHNIDNYRNLITSFVRKAECNELDIAAALVAILRKKKPLTAFGDDKIFKQGIREEEKRFADRGKRRSPRRGRDSDRQNERGGRKRRFR